MKTLFLIAVLSWAATTTTTAQSIGSACDENDDCDTESCFFGLGDAGVCACNVLTNAGCTSGTTCSVDVSSFDSPLPPYCALPDGAACDDTVLPEDCHLQETCCMGACADGGNCEPLPPLPLNEACRLDPDCETGVCFFSIQPPNTPGSCQCNADTNDGCSEGRTCTVLEFIADGPPFCALPVGAPCDVDRNVCDTTVCFNGVCQCNDFFNVGCADDEVCVGNETVGYSCQPSQTGEPSLPIGSPCEQGTGCDTDHCFFGFGDGGICACNVLTNAGCADKTTCVIDLTPTDNNDALPPFCALADGASCEPPEDTECFRQDGCCGGSCSEDGTCVAQPELPVGAVCRSGTDCESTVCFFGLVPPGTPGICQCDVKTNSGCPDERTCAVLEALPDAPPFCALPLGAACEEEFDCETSVCFEGTCQCLAQVNVGCEEGEVCVGNDSTGYECESSSSPPPPPPSTSPPSAALNVAIDLYLIHMLLLGVSLAKIFW